MKTSIYFIAGLVFLSMLPGQLRAQNLYVLENSGQQTSYVINDISKLYFSSGTLNIQMMEGIPGSYPLDGLRYLNFTDLVEVSERPTNTETKIQLYPNPVDGILHIDYNLSNTSVVSTEIISMDGRVVHAETLVNASGPGQWHFNVSSFTPGIYLCRLHCDSFMITRKFIKN